MCLRSLSLLVGLVLVLGVSALTPEECSPVVTPVSLSDRSVMFGRFKFVMGFTDSDLTQNILKSTESNWMDVSASPSSDNEVITYQENRVNGTCIASKNNLTIDGNVVKMTAGPFHSEFHVLSSCEGCLVLSVNSTTKRLNKLLLQQLNVGVNVEGEEEIHSRALYLMAKEPMVKDSDLEAFKKQAGCLGFTGEPGFVYDAKRDFCEEGEGVMMSL